MNTATYDYKTIEIHSENEYVVYGHEEYGPSSVNEGLPLRAFLGIYDTALKAQFAHPEAESIEGSTRHDYYLPECCPMGFDAANAGETW